MLSVQAILSLIVGDLGRAFRQVFVVAFKSVIAKDQQAYADREEDDKDDAPLQCYIRFGCFGSLAYFFGSLPY